MVLVLCTSSDDFYIYTKFREISQSVSELWPGHKKLTDRQTDGQGDYYRASAYFVWRALMKKLGPGQHFPHYKSMGKYFIAQGQVTLTRMIQPGPNSNWSDMF